jgi:two-component system response regulator PilR (NtrC family)
MKLPDGDGLDLVCYIQRDYPNTPVAVITAHGSEAALKGLMAYQFPGNVRELENILERAMTLCEGGRIEFDALQLPRKSLEEAAEQGEDLTLISYLDNVEKQKILATLEQTRWNKTAAARLLGINFRALRYWLEKLGLD